MILETVKVKIPGGFKIINKSDLKDGERPLTEAQVKKLSEKPA